MNLLPHVLKKQSQEIEPCLLARNHRRSTLVLVSLRDGARAETVAGELNRLFPEDDTQAFTKSQWVQAEQSYQARQTPIGFVFGFGVVIAW